MDGLIAIADAIDQIAEDRRRRMTPAERVEVEDVLEAAEAWAGNQLPIHEFAKVGTLLSPVSGNPHAGYTRYVAFLATPIVDGRRDALRRAIDALLRFQGLEITTAGVFDREDIVGVPILSRSAEHVRERWAPDRRQAA